MESPSAVDSYSEVFAEEMIKHVLVKDFGIYWDRRIQESKETDLPLAEYYTSYILLEDAVRFAWKKYRRPIARESLAIWNSLDNSNSEEIYSSLEDVANQIDVKKEYKFFIIMALFGDLCVQICRSGAEPLLSNAVSAAKSFILIHKMTCQHSLRVNAIDFMENSDCVGSAD